MRVCVCVGGGGGESIKRQTHGRRCPDESQQVAWLVFLTYVASEDPPTHLQPDHAHALLDWRIDQRDSVALHPVVRALYGEEQGDKFQNNIPDNYAFFGYLS